MALTAILAIYKYLLSAVVRHLVGFSGSGGRFRVLVVTEVPFYSLIKYSFKKNMAPREGDITGTATEGSRVGSLFWNRLNSLPVVRSTIRTTIDLYSTSKERPLIGKGLGVIEYGVNLASTPVKKVAFSIAEKYPVSK